jgi:glucoamylase
MPRGKILRIVLAAEVTAVWSADCWATTGKLEAAGVHSVDLWLADFPTRTIPADSVIEFTFFWKEAQCWEGGNYSVAVGEAKQTVVFMRLQKFP